MKVMMTIMTESQDSVTTLQLTWSATNRQQPTPTLASPPRLVLELVLTVDNDPD